MTAWFNAATSCLYFWDGTEFWHEKGFWTVPLSRWDAMFQAGVRAHYVCSVLAAPLMIAQRSGLIVNISFFAAQHDDSGVAYGVAKAATDRMAACMAHELREHNVAAVSLYPGLVRTESILRAAAHFDLSNSESPQFIGRAIAAMAGDPAVSVDCACCRGLDAWADFWNPTGWSMPSEVRRGG